MISVFLKLLNISITASWLLFAILVVRLFLRKAPKWTVCLLWVILAVRLVLPFSIESSFSLLPSAQVIPENIVQAEAPAIYSGISQINSAVNPILLQSTSQENTLEQIVDILCIVWLAGVGVMLLYSAVSWLLLRFRLRISVRQQDNVYLCDHIQSPFVFGVIVPRIYIPSGLDSSALQYVLAHEKAHIHRRDHLWKPLGYLLLSVYWFNPLMWIGYILLCRDIERACDEKVLSHIGEEGKTGYAGALLECSAHRRMILTCPVAFGEVGVAARIKNALRYKKPAYWIIAVALLLCTGVVVCFLTDPQACSHSYAVSVNAAATCTQKGLETRTCENCAHSYMAYVDVCPHTFGDATLVQAPNCSTEGQATVSCVDCGASAVRSVPKDSDAHNMVETSLIESTCTEAGVQTFTCTHCDHQETVALPKKEHQYQQTLLRQATCVHFGKREYRCKVCDHSYIEVFTANSHKWVKLLDGTVACFTCYEQRKRP